MALSVDYIYQFSRILIRKSQAAGFGNNEFQLNWNDAQGTYQDDLVGRFNAGAKSKTQLNTGLIENETILQKLSPFTLPYVLTVTNGVSNKPSDFIFRLAIRVNGFDCFHIDKDKMAALMGSVIDGPSISANNYYFTEYQNYFQFFPSAVSVANLDYIQTPPDVIWGFTWDSQNRQVYNEGISVQPLWDSNSAREITKRMLKTLGVSFKDSDFATFGQSVINAGD